MRETQWSNSKELKGVTNTNWSEIIGASYSYVYTNMVKPVKGLAASTTYINSKCHSSCPVTRKKLG